MSVRDLFPKLLAFPLHLVAQTNQTAAQKTPWLEHLHPRLSRNIEMEPNTPSQRACWSHRISFCKVAYSKYEIPSEMFQTGCKQFCFCLDHDWSMFMHLYRKLCLWYEDLHQGWEPGRNKRNNCYWRFYLFFSFFFFFLYINHILFHLFFFQCLIKSCLREVVDVSILETQGNLITHTYSDN